jgi:hypothetical protein
MSKAMASDGEKPGSVKKPEGFRPILDLKPPLPTAEPPPSLVDTKVVDRLGDTQVSGPHPLVDLDSRPDEVTTVDPNAQAVVASATVSRIVEEAFFAAEPLPGDKTVQAMPTASSGTLTGPELKAAPKFEVDLASERRTDTQDVADEFMTGVHGPEEHRLPAPWQVRIAKLRASVPLTRPAIAATASRVADALDSAAGRVLQVGPIARAASSWNAQALRNRRAIFAGAYVVTLGALYGLGHALRPKPVEPIVASVPAIVSPEKTSVAAVFKSSPKPDSERPTPADLQRLYPYGSKGQKGPKGQHAPPVAEVQFDFQGDAACGGDGLGHCFIYNFSSKSGFGGSMQVRKDPASGKWLRASDQGLPFAPGQPSKKSGHKKHH